MTLSACSWAVNNIPCVSFFKSHLLSWNLVCDVPGFLYFSCNFPSYKVFFLSSLFLFVNFSFVSLSSVTFSFSAPLSISYLLSLGSHTIFSFQLLYNPLPPSFHFIYNLSTLLFGCKHLFNVIIFLVFRSMSWSSSFVQSIIHPLYLITPIAQAFKSEMKFSEFIFDLQINFTLLMYSFPILSFISLFIVLSSWGTYTLPDLPSFLHPAILFPHSLLASFFLVLAQYTYQYFIPTSSE